MLLAAVLLWLLVWEKNGNIYFGNIVHCIIKGKLLYVKLEKVFENMRSDCVKWRTLFNASVCMLYIAILHRECSEEYGVSRVFICKMQKCMQAT